MSNEELRTHILYIRESIDRIEKRIDKLEDNDSIYNIKFERLRAKVTTYASIWAVGLSTASSTLYQYADAIFKRFLD